MKQPKKKKHAKMAALAPPVVEAYIDKYKSLEGATRASISKTFGVSATTLNNWCKKNTVPSFSNLKRILQLARDNKIDVPAALVQYVQGKFGPQNQKPFAPTVSFYVDGPSPLYTYTVSVRAKPGEDAHKVADQVLKALSRSKLKVVVHETIPPHLRPDTPSSIDTSIRSIIRNEVRDALKGATLGDLLGI